MLECKQLGVGVSDTCNLRGFLSPAGCDLLTGVTLVKRLSFLLPTWP